ncbi:methionine ABC transporter permease [Luteococcus sp.]|uniref:methionine ABC transporter permease n=1 Tax=Luteococcus sp. TaxID=1969402 RepID=UPI003735D544
MTDFIASYFGIGPDQLARAAVDTLYMVGWSLVLGTIVAIPLALALVLWRPGGIKSNPLAHGFINAMVNIVRSLPFIILMVVLMPFTKQVVGTRIGTTAALVPLTVFIAPFMARLLETSLLEVPRGIVEAAQSMGASTWQIIRYFLLPEARASIVLGLTTGTVSLVNATAMAGVIGAGGVGDLALTYGYQAFNTPLMLLTVVVLIILVQAIQSIGNAISRHLRTR